MCWPVSSMFREFSHTTELLVFCSSVFKEAQGAALLQHLVLSCGPQKAFFISISLLPLRLRNTSLFTRIVSLTNIALCCSCYVRQSLK